MTYTRATEPGERLFVDISGPYGLSPRGNRYWVMVVDDFTRKKWSFYIKSKDKVAEPIDPLIIKLKGI